MQNTHSNADFQRFSAVNVSNSSLQASGESQQRVEADRRREHHKMSDNSHLRQISQNCHGEVEHTSILSENIGALFQNEEYSDIELIVEGTSFKAHRIILAARSEYFRALLYGGMRESDPSCYTIELKDASAEAFKYLLRYIYTARINLTDIKEEILLDVLGLAHQYNFIDLESVLSDYLASILSIKNVCCIYDIAILFSLHDLVRTCASYMDRNASDILRSESYLQLSQSALAQLIDRDSFCACEIEIFNAVCEWRKNNPTADISNVVAAIRLPLMTIHELLNVVRPTNLITPDAILDAIEKRTESRDMDLKYRGFSLPEENVASARRGAVVENGELKSALLDGDSQNYDLDHGFSRHPIDENSKGLVIKLGNPHIINHIRLLLWDKDMRSYSYYIEVSMDQKDWKRVIDHREYLCRSWQNLFFPATVAKFIRIVGTRNTVNAVFHAVAFEAYYTDRSFVLDDGILVPTDNVATVDRHAVVLEGVSRCRNDLINGDWKNYDWDSGYTCHQLGSGCIVIQLPQPYVIDSMRILLWDCDDRSYSYFIEVSTDQLNWEEITDRSDDLCKSWQIVNFNKRPVVFIRITGLRNTANEVFHCVHFECPAQTPP